MKITKSEANNIRLKRNYILEKWNKNTLPIDKFINNHARQVNAAFYAKESDMIDDVTRLEGNIKVYQNAKKKGIEFQGKEELQHDVDLQNKKTYLNAFEMQSKFAALYSIVSEAKAKRNWYDYIIHPFRTAAENRAMDYLESKMDEHNITKEHLNFINEVYKNDNKPEGFLVDDKGKTIHESFEEIPDEEEFDLTDALDDLERMNRKPVDLSDEIENEPEEDLNDLTMDNNQKPEKKEELELE